MLKISQPLYHLLQKAVKWDWKTDQINAFENLKEHLIKYPILRPPDFTRKFWLFTDASSFALGFVLSQMDNDNEYVVMYGSRQLKGAEVHYGITEKECLGVVWAVKSSKVYIFGMATTVVTDHAALKWLLHLPEPTGRLARWALYLASFNIEIIHRKGTLHTNVDILSRPVLMIPNLEGKSLVTQSEPDANDKQMDVYDNEALKQFLTTGQHIAGRSKRNCKHIEKLAQQYKFVNNRFYYNKAGQELEVPHPSQRQDIATQAHLLGHYQWHTTVK